MSWPTPQEYNEAIQNPHLNFADDELKSGVVELNRLGLPQPSTGAFASVYRVKCGDRDVAVRCFLQSISDQPQRYKHLSDKLAGKPSLLFVPFEYINRGIQVANTWHPIVKMNWVQGKTLDAYVRENRKDQKRIEQLMHRFEQAVKDLSDNGIAHGDLQHGNIVIDDNDELRLIDYDGIYLPELNALGSNELGHPNYQHPGRNKALFNLQMDNFSAWVIQQSLRAIAADPELLLKLRGCEECLLLRHLDYANPARSPAFHLMESHHSEVVRECGRLIRSACAMPPNAVPALGQQNLLASPIQLAATADDSRFMSLVGAGDTLGDDEPADPFQHLPVETAGWPTLREYLAAARQGSINFDDAALKTGTLFKQKSGVWHVLGRESVVIPIQCGRERMAVKCFLTPDPTRAERYLQLETHFRNGLPWDLAHKNLPLFEYIPNGIQVNGRWYPILKMPWLAGAQTLDEFINSTPYNKYVAQALADEWRDLVRRMVKAGIAHGALEPSNILVHDGKLKLVDYDTMCIPAMHNKRYEPKVIRNPDFLHPDMPSEIFAEQDNFSAWLIDTAITAWSLDPAIYKILDNRRGHLLFSAADLADPAKSKLFALLYHNFHAELSSRAELLYRLLHMPPHKIPPVRTQAVSLLPKESARHHEMRAVERFGERFAMASGAFALGMIIFVPHSSLFALLPVVSLAIILSGSKKPAKSTAVVPKQ